MTSEIFKMEEAMENDKLKVEITLECLPEEVPIRDNVMVSGDDELDREAEKEIEKDLENGNQWAWCCVKVTASAEGLEASEFLGCVSHHNEEEFRQGGYFNDMVEMTKELLYAKLHKVRDAVEDWELVGSLCVDTGKLMIKDPAYDLSTYPKVHEQRHNETGITLVKSQYQASVQRGLAIVIPTGGDGVFEVFMRETEVGIQVMIQTDRRTS